MKTRDHNGHEHNGLDQEVYDKQVAICKAFANPTRLRILDLVAQHGFPTSAIHEQLAISQANLSQHLAILKGAGIVTTRREGKKVYCYLALPEVKQACHLIRNVLRAQVRTGRRLAL
jgi:DNA-binding transcriptional ArsR family regulator